MSSGTLDVQKCLRSRSHFLRRLRRPREKCELVRELEESRSTIDRALRELETAGFVERDDEGYRTTLAGELALSEHERHTARIEGLTEFRSALAELPLDEPLDAALFEDADVALPTQRSPHEPVVRLAEFLADADHVRAFYSAVVPQYVDLYREHVAEGMTADLVLDEGVVEWLLARHEEVLASGVEAERVSVAETTTDCALCLVVAEREGDDRPDRSVSDSPAGDSPAGNAARTGRSVGVMLYDDGSLLGFVRNDTREAVAWGERLFEQFATEAVPLDPPTGV